MHALPLNQTLNANLIRHAAITAAVLALFPLSLPAQAPDTDGDGIPDAAEAAPVPMLWDAANPRGVLRTDLAGVAEVTATETLRDVRTASGADALFDQAGSLLLATNANSTAIASDESRVCAANSDGRTLAWL
ncbi:MAG: hypothetical protein J6336_11150, partial [Kiritimatiellae bacterium]|nr:hypothetical protein [Kiritimatiellia bacterium]